MLTVNGRVETRRTRWSTADGGSRTPVDSLLDQAEAVVSVGPRELCCRLSVAGGSFARVAENLERAAGVNESDAAGQTWAGEVLHTVRHEGYEPFWEKLVDGRGSQRGTRRKLADGLLNYVAQRQEMMAYDEFERQGWKIGNGPIEAMCKATTRRLKGPGMRWDAANAEAMMALESIDQSNLWDRYWRNALCQRN